MNTRQLIAQWYTGIVVVVFLVAHGRENEDHALWAYVASTIVCGGLFVYTFRPHPEARLKTVFLCTTIPVMVLGGIMVVLFQTALKDEDASVTAKRIVPDQVEVFDVILNMPRGPMERGTIQGRVRNLSDVELDSLTIRVSILDDGREVDSCDVYVQYLNVPAKGVRSFSESIGRLRVPMTWTWTCRVVETFAFP